MFFQGVCMKYRNAEAVLPEALLAELKKYCAGELIYVPSGESKAAWGEVNGSRARYNARNRQIAQRYRDGALVHELAKQFYLSTDSIRKIVKQCAQG
jgi:Mor family transcriptional regulator